MCCLDAKQCCWHIKQPPNKKTGYTLKVVLLCAYYLLILRFLSKGTYTYVCSWPNVQHSFILCFYFGICSGQLCMCCMEKHYENRIIIITNIISNCIIKFCLHQFKCL